MNIRPAKIEDLAVIVDIYNQAVAAGQKTADIEPITIAGKQKWFADHNPEKYPIYVAEKNDSIIGYLSISAYRPGRLALRHTAEVSYYIDFDHHRTGVASRLMEHAITACPTLQIKSLFAILMESNDLSIRLLEKYGFKQWAHLPRVADYGGVEVGQVYYGLRVGCRVSDKRLIYTGGMFPDPPVSPVCYRRAFFQIEIELESELFGELRRKNKIEPAWLRESTPEELAEIGDFFLKNRESFYFLFHENGELIGSILHLGNYIKSLCVAVKHQRQGYGEKLSRYCINRILDSGYDSIELSVLDGNFAAERLYRKLGFGDKNEGNA